MNESRFKTWFDLEDEDDLRIFIRVEKVWDGFVNHGSWHIYDDVSMGWHGLVIDKVTLWRADPVGN